MDINCELMLLQKSKAEQREVLKESKSRQNARIVKNVLKLINLIKKHY